MNYTILAVDDDRTHCYALTRMLEAAGYSVVSANSGFVALGCAILDKPDLILLDINLPDISGIDVCRILKRHAETRAIPVIFHTATDSGSAEMAHQCGASAFLTYPIEKEHLLNVIRGCLFSAAATVA